MFYNSRKRVYNMGVKSERNLNSSRADDLNQLIIFPPYHIVNPRDASLGDLLFFVFVTPLAFLCLFNFSLDLRFYCGFFVDLSVFLRLFSAAYRFFCTDFSFSSLNSVFPADLGFTAFLPFFALPFSCRPCFLRRFFGQPERARPQACSKNRKKKECAPAVGGGALLSFSFISAHQTQIALIFLASALQNASH